MKLAVQKREKLGKAVKSLRKAGVIPAEFYGHKKENFHLSVNEKDFQKVFEEAGENTVVNLLIEGRQVPALIHDVQRDFLGGNIIHADFYGIRLDEKIKIPVPLEFVGEAPAVKEKSGILNKTLSEIEAEALPSDIPHNFVVDVSVLLDLNQSVYVKDIKVSPRVEILLSPETVVATITPPREEEKVEAPVEVSEVKVEAEEKVAERAARQGSPQAEKEKESKGTKENESA